MTEDAPEVGDEDVYTAPEEGRSYHGSSYIPTAYDNLDLAPESERYPDQGRAEDGSEEGGYRVLDLPRVPKLSHVIGPSAILLGASLGSGETLFWPLLVAANGWAIYWLFVLGVGTQFFINTEIQRWTVATGESVFRAFERVSPAWPLALLVGGFLSLGWPGWAAGAAQIGTTALGINAGSVGPPGFSLASWEASGIALLVLIWLSYQVTPVMYNVVERVQIVLVTVAVIVVFLLFVLTGSPGELTALPGAVLAGGAFPPEGEVALVLGAIAFAGAGGYLNLSQSLWIREKGYGMGRYQGRVKNPVVGDEPEPVQRDGFTFPPTPVNLRRWRGWWRLVQYEHLLTFVLGLVVTATMLMALAAKHAPGTTNDAIVMWTENVVPELGAFPAGLLFVALFSALVTTEYGIVESVVRNSADVIYELHGRAAGWSLPRIFWTVLTAFVLWGIAILAAPLPIPMTRPFGFLVAGATLSGLLMWPYTALLTVVNTTRLPEHTQPGWPRVVTMWWATAFFGYFSALLIGNWLSAIVGPVFDIELTVVGSEPGGYLVFAIVGVLQAVVVAISTRGKRSAANAVADADQARGRLS
jgi:hypothetical protein